MILLSCLATLLEFICVYILAKFITNTSFIPKQIDIIFCLLDILFVGCFPKASSVYLLFAGQVILISYFLVTETSKLTHSILLYGFIFACITLLQTIIIMVLGITDLTLFGTYEEIIGCFLTLLLLCFSCLVIPYRKIYHWLIHTALLCRIILINTYLITLGLTFFYKINMQTAYQSYLFLFLLITLLLAANSCILYYDFQLDKKEQLLLSYQKNQPIYADLIHDIRASQHEYSNRIQHLENLPLTCKDYDSLCNALSNYTKQYKKTIQAYPLLRINMPLLAASLYSLYTQAEAQQIHLQFDVVSEVIQSSVPEYELSDYLCILTQNAIEACSPGDTIYVHMISENGQLHFSIRNPSKIFYSPEEINEFFHKGFTTKKDSPKDSSQKHGYGLYQLLSNIRKQHGTICADCLFYDGVYWIVFELEI